MVARHRRPRRPVETRRGGSWSAIGLHRLRAQPGLVAHAAGLPHLRLRGLMTMAPFTDDVAVQRAAFAGLRGLRDRLAAGADGSRLTADGCLSELSMGMSNDFEVAVEEGATMVRLGTALFGERTA